MNANARGSYPVPPTGYTSPVWQDQNRNIHQFAQAIPAETIVPTPAAIPPSGNGSERNATYDSAPSPATSVFTSMPASPYGQASQNTSMPANPYGQAGQSTSMPANPYTQAAPHASTPAAPHASTPAAPRANIPADPNTSTPANPRVNAPKRDMELWLGRYAIGIVAAALVFLGVAYFTVALIPHLADEVKVAIMFSLSIAVTVAGSLLAVFRQNGFTTALMGCGAGSLFISVLATHLYFGMLAEIPAFGLILVWMLMCLLLVRKTQSLLLGIVLQLGLAVSVCLGFASGFDADKLWLLVGYQLVASAIVVGGNLVFCRRMYRSSLMLALALSLITSLFIADYCGAFQLFDFTHNYDRPIEFIAVVFALQFASATAFAVMLAFTVMQEYNSTSQNYAVPSQQPTANMGNVRDFHDIRDFHDARDARDFRDFRGTRNTCDTHNTHDFRDTHDVHKTHDTRGTRKTRSTHRSLTALLIIDAILWLSAVRADVTYPIAHCVRRLQLFGYSWTPSFFVGTVCMLAVVAAACIGLTFYARKRSLRLDHGPLCPAVIVLSCGGAAAAFLGSFATYAYDEMIPVGLLWIWALFTAAFARKTGDRSHAVVALVCLAAETLLVSIVAFPSFTTRFGIVFAMVLGALYAVGLCTLTGWLLARWNWQRGGTVLLAIMGTVLVMAFFAYCTPLEFEGWVWSICCMTCALAWVVLGFAMRHAQLRLCGLVVVLSCVAKLVLLDLAGFDPTSRTIAYIGGGLICFAVSALYNFATRRFGSQ